MKGVKAMELCQKYVQENPRVTTQREELKNRLERLRVASEELLEI